ncbi:MAG: hypothetical protein Q9181_000064 [Wetmoreana brouardii]
MDISKPDSPKSQSAEAPISQTITIRNLPWTYFHLILISTTTLMSTSSAPAIDILTARTYFTSALQQFLGMTGTAIPIDFLKVEGRDVWIRVPREDSAIVMSALSGWTGSEGVAWRTKGKSEWLGSLTAGDGRELFEP